jgi:hypothetical protein
MSGGEDTLGKAKEEFKEERKLGSEGEEERKEGRDGGKGKK